MRAVPRAPGMQRMGFGPFPLHWKCSWPFLTDNDDLINLTSLFPDQWLILPMADAGFIEGGVL